MRGDNGEGVIWYGEVNSGDSGCRWAGGGGVRRMYKGEDIVHP